ncbi:MAG: heavy metal translocating P-type ATPase [Burkholderiaceae bacterium]
MESFDLHIEGMTCAACSGRIENALNKLSGVHAEVSLLEHRARVTGTDIDTAIGAIRRTGYDAWPMHPRSASAATVTRSTFHLTSRPIDQFRLWVSVIGLAVMTAEMVGMLIDHHGRIPLAWQWGLATLMQTVVAWPFYQHASRAARAGTAIMDTLVSIGTLTAYGWSCAALAQMGPITWLSGPPAGGLTLYFETSIVVLAMVTIGRSIEQRARRHALDALSQLITLDTAPVEVRSGGTGQWQALLPNQVNVGDHVRIPPNTAIRLDCVITEGQTEVDESAMTGESQPVVKSIGLPLFEGCTNLAGTVIAQVSARFSDSRRAKIGERLLSALGSRAPIAALADKIAAIFVPAVLLLAFATWLGYWWWTGRAQTGMIHAVAVLVVACPCALGLATPAAIAAGLARSAQFGWLFRSAEALQRAANIDHVVFDKTGTLTSGRPKVLAISTDDPWPLWLAAAASAERGVEHPLAGALLSHAAGRPMPDVTAVHVHPGLGVSATILDPGSARALSLRVGQPAWINQAPTTIAHLHPDASAVDVEMNGTWAGRIWLADTLRDDAPAAIDRLAHQGITSEILSGDREPAVQRIAQALAISTASGETSPEQKATCLDRYGAQGRHCAMVGDGINDASAMAHAHLGIAMGSGANLTLETADLTISSQRSLIGVADSLALAQSVMRRVKENLFFAFAFNTLAIPMAVTGKLSPAIAGAAMALSSSLVMINAARLRRWTPAR